MKKTIAIFTTTRAEFGIFSALLTEIDKTDNIKYLLFVGGSHLAFETGKTINEITNLNYPISETFDYQLNISDDTTLCKSLGNCTVELANIFKNFNFDFVCVLGDRIELLSIITNAIVFRKPIIHIHGGEKTEGAIDEQIRHMVTKASHIHFPTCTEYANNIINMGEVEWRVHNVGALAVDNMKMLPKLTKTDLFEKLRLSISKPTVLLTYHPVTLEFTFSALEQITNVFEALKCFDYQIVITAPNADKDREIVYNYIQKQLKLNNNFIYIESLGVKNYLNLIPHCIFVIGNSSSAIIEVPYFKIPVINIGDRQKGRIMHENIISCDYTTESIKNAVLTANNKEFEIKLKDMNYKFGDGNTAKKMLDVLKAINIDEKLLRKHLEFNS